MPENDLEPGVFDRLADGCAGRLGEGGVEETARNAGMRDDLRGRNAVRRLFANEGQGAADGGRGAFRIGG